MYTYGICVNAHIYVHIYSVHIHLYIHIHTHKYPHTYTHIYTLHTHIYIYNCMLYESDTGFFLIYIVYITVTDKQ
jgi:hypothetical protein